MIQLFPRHYSTVTMMAAAADGTGEKLFSYKLKWLRHAGAMPAAMVPAMPAAALRHLTAMWKPDFTDNVISPNKLVDNNRSFGYLFKKFGL